MDDDWDTDCTPSTGSTSTYQPVVNGFGASSGNALLGMGRGLGRSTGSSNTDQFSSSNNDFGSGRAIVGTGGFGGRNNSDADNFSSFGNRSNRSGGFGDDCATNGFGSSNESGNRGGFGSRNDRGFGARRGGDGGNSRACFKCNEEGHMSRDCPQQSQSRSKGCFNCGEDGHMSRDCPNPRTSGGGRGGRTGGDRRGRFGDSGNDSEPRGGGFGQRSGFGGDQDNGAGFGSSNGGRRSGFGNDDSAGDGGGFGGSGGFNRRKGGGFGDDPEGGDSQRGRFGGSSRGGFGGGNRREDGAGGEGPDGRKRPAIYIPPPEPEDEESIFQSLQKGINFDKYDQIQVCCTGKNSLTESQTLKSFQEADLDEIFKTNIRKSKYDKPTPIQKWAIPAILQGRDVMACAQTGSGKTAAFLLPILTMMRRQGIEGSSFSEYQTPQAIIVGPTRELVIQINHEARKFAHDSMINSVVVYGGTSKNSQRNTLMRGTHIVVGTPGRLLDYIKEGVINLSRVRFVVLDEADRMLDLGFKGSIKELMDNANMPPKTERQTLMFSATFPREIQELAADLLKDYLFIVVGVVGNANTDIEQTIIQVDQFSKREQLLGILNNSGSNRVLVFVEQKRHADFLASFLSQSGFPTTSIHGDREQREREEALRDFKSGAAKILVATSVAARGLDIQGVDHVVNFDLPESRDDYVHRIGRTGRCGNIGRATSFFDPAKDHELARPLVQLLTDAQQQVPDWLESIAEGAVGTGGFTGIGGQFGAVDARSRRGRGGGGGSFGGGRDGGPSRNFADSGDRFASAQHPLTTSSSMTPYSAPSGANNGDDEMWD